MKDLVNFFIIILREFLAFKLFFLNTFLLFKAIFLLTEIKRKREKQFYGERCQILEKKRLSSYKLNSNFVSMKIL